MDKHNELFEAAKKAVEDLFGDDSVPQSQTRQDLEQIKEDIDMMLETLEE